MRKSLKHKKLSALRVAGVLPIVGAGLMLFSFTTKTPEIVYTDAKTVMVNIGGLLVLVDGKEVKNLDAVDPNAIERIDVLKDAAAVEKYGARAKNGVIVVTLKKEMVDTGYGKIERRSSTSATSTVDMKGIESYSSLKDYIRGRVAGVSFVGDQLIVRGINSINSGIEALVVIDGVPAGSFADANASINPADVASITVLKDAGSTGIYGVRGANGVVLIRTKTGR